MKKRFLCIYFPNWAVDLIQRKLPVHSAPNGIFLVTKVNNQLTVIRECQKARRAGIKEGSALTLAQAFLPNATVVEFNPLSDFKALYKLCTWTNRFTPLMDMDPELVAAYKQKSLSNIDTKHFGINLDITGTERIHRGEQSLLKNIDEKMRRARFDARMAIAPTFGAAWALSRYAPERIFIFNNSSLPFVLNSIPVEGLRLSQKVSEAMKDVGLKTIGMLLDIPRKAIAKRYGTQTLQRLDQAFGEQPESISPIPMPNHWAVFREFEYAINKHEQIVEASLELLEELTKNLFEKGRRARHFALYLQGEDLWGVPYRLDRMFSILFASDNGGHIRSLLSPLVERLSLPGPVYVIGLTTKDTEKISSTQACIDGSDVKEAQSTELLNQLAIQVGEKNVCEVRFSNSFLPETSYALAPVGQSQPGALEESRIRDRPSKLLEVPEEISAIAMLPDSPPVRIKWKGSDLKVVKGFGPERITTPWWECEQRELVSRDYYRVEDETGRWLWIYRNTSNYKWFLQGLWV